MKSTPAAPHSRFLWGPLRRAVLAVLVVGFSALPAARGLVPVPITVPNFSFESPTTNFVTAYAWTTPFPAWQMLPQPADFNTNQGYTWGELAGIFINTPAGSSNSVTNINGNQLGYLFNDQGAGLYQTLTNTYQVGTSYAMTVGIVGQGGGMPDGSIIQLVLFYLDVHGNIVPIATTTATENSTNFPNHITEFDYTVSIPAVQATDAWANQPIGIEIVSSEGPAAQLGGYWDVDNVRLNSFPPGVPTPGWPGMAACAVGLLSWYGWRRNFSRRTT